MEYIEVIPIISGDLNNITKEILDVIEKIEKYENLEEGINAHLFDVILVLVKSLNYNNIFTIKEEHFNKAMEFIDKISDSFEKEIIEVIYFFDFWKFKYLKEMGFKNYFEKVINNLDALITEIKLLIWLLLYKRSKERVIKYKDKIKQLIDFLEEKIVEFIPEEEISEEEKEKIEKIIEENKEDGYVAWENFK